MYQGKDQLDILYKISIDMYRYKVVRFITTLCMLTVSSMSLIVFYVIVKSHDFDLFIRRIPEVFGTTFGVVSGIIVRISMDRYNELAKTGVSIVKPIDYVDEKTTLKLLKLLKIFKYLVILYLITITMGSALFYPIIEEKRELYYIIVLFETYLGEYSTFATVFFFVTSYPYLFLSQIYFFMYLFIAMHILIQWYLLTKFIKQNLMDPKMDRQEIKKNLKILVDWHADIRWYKKSIEDVGFWPMILCMTTGAIMSVISIFFAFTLMTWLNLPRCIVFGGIILVIVGTVSYSGQLLTDYSEDFSSILYECPWYEWDIQSQKDLVTILSSTHASFALTAAGFVEINHDLSLKIWKYMYTMVAVLRNYLDRHHHPTIFNQIGLQ